MPIFEQTNIRFHAQISWSHSHSFPYEKKNIFNLRLKRILSAPWTGALLPFHRKGEKKRDFPVRLSSLKHVQPGSWKLEV
jgi:hypothetical protein